MLKDMTDKEVLKSLEKEKVMEAEWSAILYLEEEEAFEEYLGGYCDSRIQRDYDELKIN